MKPLTPIELLPLMTPMRVFGDGIIDKSGVTIADCLNRNVATSLAHAANHIGPLVEALEDAKRGLALAYDAVMNGRNDEALLHCGVHEARAAKILAAAKSIEVQS